MDESDRLCQKVSTVLAILSENFDDLSDDTYTEKFVTDFSKKLLELRGEDPEKCFRFWVDSGAQKFVKNLQNCDETVKNFGLKFLSESVKADVRIGEEAIYCLQLFCRQEEPVDGNSNIFILIKSLLLTSGSFPKCSLSKLLSREIWHKVFATAIQLKLKSHFALAAITDSCVTFLAKLLEQVLTEELPNLDALCCDIVASLSAKHFNDYMADVLLQCLPKRPNFNSNFGDKLRFIFESRKTESPRVKMLLHMMTRGYGKAQDDLADEFESGIDVRRNLHNLGTLLRCLEQDEVDFDENWIARLERLVQNNESRPESCIVILDQLAAIQNSKFRQRFSKTFFAILKTFFEDGEARNLNLSSEQKKFLICLSFFEQNLSILFDERTSSVEQKDFWILLVGLSRRTDVSPVIRSKIFDLMGQFISLENLDLPALTEEENLFSQIWMSCRTGDWEVLDSFIGLCTKIVRMRFGHLPSELLFDFSRKNVDHSDSFIRASAVELLFELLITNASLQNRFEVENFVRNVFKFETEAVVRRICARKLKDFGAKNIEICRTMVRALLDHDWEVKEEVLNFWIHVLHTKMSEKSFKNFDSFVRTLSECDVMLALKISSSEFEQRQLHKTFHALDEIRTFCFSSFPDLKLEDVMSLNIVEVEFATNDDETIAGNHESDTRVTDIEKCDVIEDILGVDESKLINDCFFKSTKLNCANGVQKLANNLGIVDVERLPSTNVFLQHILFQTNFEEKFGEFDEFCERQIGLESLLDDVIQSASKCDSHLDGVDCF